MSASRRIIIKTIPRIVGPSSPPSGVAVAVDVDDPVGDADGNSSASVNDGRNERKKRAERIDGINQI
jgi:hypothetical protein